MCCVLCVVWYNGLGGTERQRQGKGGDTRGDTRGGDREEEMEGRRWRRQREGNIGEERGGERDKGRRGKGEKKEGRTEENLKYMYSV